MDMRTITAMLAGAALFGSGVLVTHFVSDNDSTSSKNASSSRHMQQGPGANGQRGGSGDRPSPQEMMKIRKELRERTMDELGIDSADMLAARKKAIESMVDDDLLSEEQSQRMIQGMEARTACMEKAKSPQDCMDDSQLGGGMGGPGGGQGGNMGGPGGQGSQGDDVL